MTLLAATSEPYQFQWEIIIAVFISAIVGPLLVWHLKDVYTRRNVFRRVNKRIQLDNWVVGKLGILLGATEASRVYIFQVHPEHDPIYISQTYELTAPGVSAEITGHQNLLLSEHNFVLNELIQSHQYLCEDVSTIPDEKLRLSLQAHDTKSVYIVGLFSAHGHIKGFLAMDYVHATHTLSAPCSKLLNHTAYEISPRLCEYISR